MSESEKNSLYRAGCIGLFKKGTSPWIFDRDHTDDEATTTLLLLEIWQVLQNVSVLVSLSTVLYCTILISTNIIIFINDVVFSHHLQQRSSNSRNTSMTAVSNYQARSTEKMRSRVSHVVTSEKKNVIILSNT